MSKFLLADDPTLVELSKRIQALRDALPDVPEELFSFLIGRQSVKNNPFRQQFEYEHAQSAAAAREHAKVISALGLPKVDYMTAIA